MAYTVAVTDLMMRARQRADIVGASARYPDSEVLSNLNASIAYWYDLVRLTTWGGQYYRKQQAITTVAGVESYALAADFASVLFVDIVVSGTARAGMRPFQNEGRNAYRWPLGQMLTWPGYYQLQGPNITFQPGPPGAYQIFVTYEPTAPILDLVTVTTFDTINGWEEFLACDTAIKCLLKDGDAAATEVASLRAERQREEARIVEAAANRDKGAAEVIHDVSGGGWDDYPWGGMP